MVIPSWVAAVLVYILLGLFVVVLGLGAFLCSVAIASILRMRRR